MELRQTLRALIKERGLTLSKVARDAGISKGYMWELLNRDKDPSAKILDKIGKVLGVTVDDLLHPGPQRISRPVEPYAAECIRCRSRVSLVMIPHRHENGVNGWLFSCARCLPFVEGGTVAITIKARGEQ